MTSSRMLRPALVCLAVLGAGLSTASCGMIDSDPHRFETMARNIADIPLDGSARVAPKTAAHEGLRPAMASSRPGLKVDVMDPHDLWDARDAGLRGVVEKAGEVAAPAVLQRVAARITERPAAEAAPMRASVAAPKALSRTTIQLGAYSTPEGAQAAWSDISTGSARKALQGLSPVFETVQVNGRPFTRLKVAAPRTAAVAICRAAEVSDPWCARVA